MLPNNPLFHHRRDEADMGGKGEEIGIDQRQIRAIETIVP
jgi:hypothetical protein